MNERTRTVIFSHGHVSGPRSMKIVELEPVARKAGFETLAIDYRDLQDDPVARAGRLIETVREQAGPTILVGSSMGGWVSMHAAETVEVAGLFLMAPALFLEDRVPEGVVPESYTPKSRQVAVVHGWHDDIIPWQHSLRFAEANKAALHLLDSDHRLESALAQLKAVFKQFLDRVD
ncbi:alpha/beta hydrolase [Wenzhouxiangella sediminis]|uniref:Palmitoyl-protein thioesterase ABHD10, mitochondrial n=1 Tax=Wenzhouxiangella sediminis TaxID=1792836 RepID=A0A3E1K4J3_9GAMM|nr:alpha/beta fold hydrolase [Wenzhouxiangella sediminis]RFF28878.1 alpha/beta fold hydrolase [Wenzhouxiangella sediminis]